MGKSLTEPSRPKCERAPQKMRVKGYLNPIFQKQGFSLECQSSLTWQVVFPFPRGLTLTTIPQQGDLRLLGPPTDHGAGSRARTRDRWVPADLGADSQTTMPPTPLTYKMERMA
ncbi:hypothetical protein PoB_000645400 [Plakobranchus ocellatus]|uniref:Uncharacterized protein n=1 Tax=Plakobranchus ocellatus TaxID=259542 RepID=A0AAV3YAE4_9GAST|nr:hypothetical protein PoB_000645400 [Plakobranchus ocellatus]